MIRTILVTEVKNIITNEVKEIYGRYDAVKLQKDGYQIRRTFKRRYKMSDQKFALNAQRIEDIL